jgi:hypothetical protein
VKKGKRQSLVSQYLENVSRKALEEYQDVVRNFVRGRHGIYVLYRRDRLYYVGLASNLRNRLKAHLKDRHGASWDRFSVYLTIQDGHIRELESLALRILKPVGNRVGGKFARAENLRTRLAREIRELERGRLMEIMGTQPRSKPRKAVRKPGKIAGAPVLAKYANRPARLRRRYKGKFLIARVRPDGSIRFAGEVFNSPSLAAHAAIGRTRAVNGWLFWTYERAPGDWVQLNELRK